MQSRSLNSYKSITDALRIAVDGEGFLSATNAAGTKDPLKIGGKRAVLPTPARLAEGFPDTMIAWHPLCESPARRGTSPVMQSIVRNAKYHIAWTLEYLVEELLKIAADQDQHKSVPPHCSDFLEKLTDLGKNPMKLLKALIQGALKNHRLVTIYLKSEGKYAGQKVTRLASIRFPILEDLSGSKEPKLYGVAISQKERKAMSALFRLVVPNGDDPEEYSAGTNSRVAPYLTAFLLAYTKVIRQFNKVINKYGEALNFLVKPFPDLEDGFVEGFENYYNEIPKLEGNDGERMTEEEKAAEQESLQAYKTPVADPTVGIPGFKPSVPMDVNTIAPVTAAQNVAPQPTRHPVAQPAGHAEKKLSPDDFMALARGQAQPQQQFVQQAPQGYNVPQPQPFGYVAPQQPVQQFVNLLPNQPQFPTGPQPSNNPFAGVMGTQGPQPGQPAAPFYGYQPHSFL